jgi:hypothetical protein
MLPPGRLHYLNPSGFLAQYSYAASLLLDHQFAPLQQGQPTTERALQSWNSSTNEMRGDVHGLILLSFIA